jgi:hypothetical protein
VPADEIEARVLAEARAFLDANEKYDLPLTMCERFLVPDLHENLRIFVRVAVYKKCDQLLEDAAARSPASPPRRNSSKRRRQPTAEDRARGQAIRAALDPYRERNQLTWEGLAQMLGMRHSAFWDVLAGQTRRVPPRMRHQAAKLKIELPPN